MFLAQWGWLALLAGVPLNVLAIRRRARLHIVAHPELAAGYRRLLRGFAFWMSLPWLVMGVGCTIGGVPTLFHFLRPVAGGPFVWAFWVVAYTEFLLLGWWAVRGGGAEALVRHPGLIVFRTGSVTRMRWFLAGLSVFAVAWNTGCLVWLA